MADSGTPELLRINGAAYKLSDETDVTIKVGKYTLEAQPTTGTPNIKRAKQDYNIEGCVITEGAAAINVLEQFVDSGLPGDLELQLASGTVYTNTGFVSSEGTTSQDNKTAVMLIGLNPWTKIIV